ncbi:MAG: T9SS type A sorting domain-containing protein [Saprospiraceae bacterium]|nr:T9SS type A sorting domain-containing protein [Saprospiraceae bacterium]
MMQKFFFLIILLSVSILDLMSQDYFPLNENIYWIYNRYDIDNNAFIQKDSNTIILLEDHSDTIIYLFEQFFNIPEIDKELIQKLAELKEKPNDIFYMDDDFDLYKIFQHQYQEGDSIQHGPDKGLILGVSFIGDYTTQEGITYENCYLLGNRQDIDYIFTPVVGLIAGICYADNYFVELVGSKRKFITTTQINELGNAFKLYPNPAMDDLFISGIENIQDIKIFGVGGKMANQIPNSNHNKIDVSDLLPGFYVISFLANNKRFSQSFIKVKG